VALMLRWRSGRHPAWLVAAGVAGALGVASKWSAAFPCAVAALAVVGPTVWRIPDRRERAGQAALAATSLVAFPVALYVLTFWPWLGRGYGLADLVTFHTFMARETATHVGYAGTKLPDYANELIGAWRWFLQPCWYVDVAGTLATGEHASYLVGVTNPLTWLLVLPAATLAGWRALGPRRDRPAGLALALFLSAYLPFVGVPRPIWANSAVTVLPWAAALLGLAASTAWSSRRAVVVGWLGLACAFALVFWFPAVGISTAPTEAAMHLVVPDRAFQRHGDAP
jgi:dolichyl-phosphate-mannose--protein O-mannosyl transferase